MTTGRRIALLPALAALLMVACGGTGGGGSPSDPEPFTLTLTAVPTSIGPQGIAQVVVQAHATAGASVAGLRIALATTLGTLDRTELTTDATGRATSVLRGNGGSGTARLTARLESRGVTAQAEVRVGLDRSLALSVEPGTIAGSQEATVTVLLFDPSGAPAPQGTAVTVATSRGVLGATTLLTDALGAARTTLRTGGESGTAVVTATAAGLTGSTQVSLRPAYELRLQANPSTISGSGRAEVTVRVVALDPAAPVANRQVLLQASRGRLDATSLRTSGLGVATTSLSAAGDTGSALLTATMPGAEAATAVVFLGGAGATVSLTASPTAVAASGGATTLTVLVSNADGSPVAAAQVDLATSRGQLELTRLHTSGAGLATTTLRGDGSVGQAVVTATLAGTGASDQVIVTFL